MNELQLLSSQQPGHIELNNFQELKSTLSAFLIKYQNIVYSDESLAAAKADKKELSRLRRQIDERRKEIKRDYLAPYNDFENKIKELLAMIDGPLDEIKKFVSAQDDLDKQKKQEEIEEYFFQHSKGLGQLADQMLSSPAFFDSKWLNKSTSAKTWQEAVNAKIAAAKRDLQTIQTIAGPHIGALTAKYMETLSTEGLAEYQEKLVKTASASLHDVTASDRKDNRQGSVTVRLSGNMDELLQALDALKLLNVDCEILEEDIPQPMNELSAPDFDSFVAFDLETSGTYGAAYGDDPAEITEIGAVRVVNDEITEMFSTLVNPGRNIVPRISKITGITDEMVENEPDVKTAIRLFAEFVDDSILVGHNIKASDLHYIDRALQKAGIRMENSFFDTYPYAKSMKEKYGWENVKLEYLAEKFDVEQSDAHRAWCDAKANVGVFFKLRKLGF